MATLGELLGQPEALADWVRQLPKQDSTALTAQVTAALAALLKAPLQPAQVLFALELLREPAYRAVRGLSQAFLHDSTGITPDNQKAATTVLQVLNTLGSLHGNLVAKLHQDQPGSDTIAVALHRALADHIALQQAYYQLYLPIAEKQWLKLHRRFLIANQLKLTGFACEDKALGSGLPPLTVQQLYCVALLLGCARVNQLLAREIGLTTQLLCRWAPLVQLDTQRTAANGSTFVVDISSDAAPSFQAFASLGEGAMPCYLRIDGLMGQLQQLLAATSGIEASTPAGPVPVRLLQHLQSAWGEFIQREERIPADETLTATLGLANVHYYLCGQQDAQAFVGPQKMRLSIAYEAHEDVALIESQRSGDVWSKFLSKDVQQLGFGEIPDSFHFQQRFEASGAADTARFPVATVHMLDRSEHGCRLEWPASDAASVAIGDLVGLRNGNGQWQLGEVAWQTREGTDRIRTGVKLLGRQAIPLSAEKLMGMQTADWLPVILLPRDADFRDKPAVLAGPASFKARDIVTVCQKGIEHRLQLTERLRNHPGYQLFACGFVLEGN